MEKMKAALEALLKKYDVALDPRFNPVNGELHIGKPLGAEDIPLQIWRSDRRFTELAKLVDNQTIENVCLLRFSHMTDSDTTLDAILYEEFDLCEFIAKGEITSLHAVFTDNHTGNIIIKLSNKVIESVEVGNLLPDGKSDIERHEVVARRGVANDIPVDVQIPQQSIFTFTTDGETGYRDVDFELFGFSEKEIHHIRSRYDFYKDTSKAEELRKKHFHLSSLAEAAFLSDKEKRKIEIKEI